VAEQDQKRLVVNMSWGLYYLGTLDGNSLLSQAIDAYSDQGITFVNSGGNNGDVNFHIKKTFAEDTLRSRIQFYDYAQNSAMWGQSITAWGEPGESFSIGFSMTTSGNTLLHDSPWFHSQTQSTYVDSFFVQGNDTVFYNLAMDAAHPLNGRPHARLRVKNRASTYRIVMKATASTGTVHFWNVTELTNGVGNWGMAFQAGAPGYTAGDEQYGISEPACTASLITVAAYNSDFWSNGNLIGGNIASFSSFGPTIDERMKPDIAAPGLNVASSISAFTDDDYTELTSVMFNGVEYPFARFSGTSMAAPMVTGTVALMLEADPDATPSGIKAFIKGNARTDEDTGVIPSEGSTRWGMGKLNAYQAIVHQLGVVAMEEDERDEPSVWPSPATSTITLHTRGNEPLRIAVFDAMGRRVLEERHPSGGTLVLDVQRWAPGVYALRMEQGRQVRSIRIVKE
ncbi:MAG: S8 family peptidase, partial [Flavobacteriales bacterium]|nr:S8 family peptidase [Flavobacteriales bacterium]